MSEHQKNIHIPQKTTNLCSDVKGHLSGAPLPSWIKGVFLINSPGGLFDSKSENVKHWFDGLSLISSFKIDEHGRSTLLTKKHILSGAYQESMKDSKALVKEITSEAPVECVSGRRESRILMKYPSMSLAQIKNQDYKENCNCAIFQFGKSVMATSETAMDRVFSPDTLETGNSIDYSHLVNFKSGRPQQDHYGDVYNIAASYMCGNKYHFIKFACPKDELCHNSDNIPREFKFVATIPSRFTHHLSYFHSFGMTDNFLIFCEQPLTYDTRKLKSCQDQGNSFKDSFEWLSGERNQFYVVDKTSGHNIEINYITDKPYFFFNFVNCYEYGSYIIIDLLAYDGPEILDNMWLSKMRADDFKINDLSSNSNILRFVLPLDFNEENIDLNHDQWNESIAIRQRENITLQPKVVTLHPGMDLPKVNPNFSSRKYRYAYVVGWMNGFNPRNFYVASVIKVDVETGKTMTWKAEDKNAFPSEVVFIPHPSQGSEDDGILISCITYSKDVEKGSYLVFINARNMEEVSRISFEEFVPIGTHSIFFHRS
ncbi:BCMO1 [Lepeophtheirus salmonis]|uniref:BCMO1 n=1 Tax=Lepeophtheirus salmonis TaxID=72036 RepID=A0A7R8CCI4_LEPSM|nr:BCMO1 [Lepeophtheirus salmonis]CAF2764053.1 BCMO1 [Lepeophtheirus salmonis]